MKILNLLIIIFLLAFASISFGQITGTAHDFSGASWNSDGEICITCHTPHNAIAGEEPLWNHDLSTQTYTLYSSSTFDGNGTIGQPDGSSKLCLSCHDGTVAVDNYQGNGYTTPDVFISDASFLLQTGDLGTDLSNDHPISFTYDAALATADGELNAPTSLDPAIQLDGTGKMQCSSCHDVHSNAIAHFLVLSNAASALCLECHAK